MKKQQEFNAPKFRKRFEKLETRQAMYVLAMYYARLLSLTEYKDCIEKGFVMAGTYNK